MKPSAGKSFKGILPYYILGMKIRGICLRLMVMIFLANRYERDWTYSIFFSPPMRIHCRRPESGFSIIEMWFIEFSIEYSYDKRDKLAAKRTICIKYEYAYDDLYRLVPTDGAIRDGENYTYDNAGNRLTAADTTGPWAYNPNNELGDYDDVTYEYDANGNMTKKTGGVVTSYVYNTEDRLTQVWDGEVGTGSLTASYYYDPFGRRLWKDVGATRTYFHYADEGLIGEYDRAGAEIKTYGYKPRSTWTTDPLFMKVGGEYYFYHTDSIGTPQKMTNISGAVVWSAKYSSFGKADVDPASSVTNNLRFPGQYYDNETGQYYNWKRYYDSAIGRYLRLDPIGIEGGINLYSYSSNSPINYFDSTGTTDEKCECPKTCAESEYKHLEKCENVRKRGFEYKSEDAAFNQMKRGTYSDG